MPFLRRKVKKPRPRGRRTPGQPPFYSLHELCYRCYSFRIRHGDMAKHRPCFEPGCFCWCSIVKGFFA